MASRIAAYVQLGASRLHMCHEYQTKWYWKDLVKSRCHDSYYGSSYSYLESAGSRSLLKDSIFWSDSGTLRINFFVRKRGRPHLEWTSEVYKHVVRVADGLDLLATPVEWMRAVDAYIQQLSSF